MKEKPYMWMEIIQKKDRAVVYGYDYYPESSVLAGQYRKNFIESFSGCIEAEEAYPEAGMGHELLQPENSFDHLEGCDE